MSRIRDDSNQPPQKPPSVCPSSPPFSSEFGAGLYTGGRVAVECGSAGFDMTQGFVRSVYYCGLAELQLLPPVCQLDGAGKSSLISLSLSLTLSLLLYLLAFSPFVTICSQWFPSS